MLTHALTPNRPNELAAKQELSVMGCHDWHAAMHSFWLLGLLVCLLVGCITSQQHASVSQGWICSDDFTCCHTEIEAADQTFYLTQSQYTDTGPTSPSTDPITPVAWKGSHWSANFGVTGKSGDMTRPTFQHLQSQEQGVQPHQPWN